MKTIFTDEYQNELKNAGFSTEEIADMELETEAQETINFENFT